MTATSGQVVEPEEGEGGVEVALEEAAETQADVYAESNEVCIHPGGHEWIADEQVVQSSGLAPDLGSAMQTILPIGRGEGRQRCMHCGRLRWAER